MLCYGRHTNLGLLEHYGFLLDEKESETGGAEPGNPHDTAAFALGFDLDDTDDATAVTTSVTTTTTTTSVVEASAVDGSLEWEATRGLRLWAARRRPGGFGGGKGGGAADKRIRDAASRGFAVGADVERRAFKAVADAAAAALTSVHLATTAKFDADALARAKGAAEVVGGTRRDSEVIGGTSEDGTFLPGGRPERRRASGREETARTARTTTTRRRGGTARRRGGTAARRSTRTPTRVSRCGGGCVTSGRCRGRTGRRRRG